ncbi:MAG: hypothetical protein RL410_99 [Actinomycetota bacterium]
MTIAIGDRVEISIDRVAHGGHCVGRFDGQVVFVRHTLPGEKVLAEITKVSKKLAFADAVEVWTPSPHRVSPPCKYAGACGGCDWQHADIAYQREMKTSVLQEQLVRLGKLSADSDLVRTAKVLPLRADENGLNWRTRVEYATDARGRAGFRRHSSHDVVTVSECVVAVPSISGDGITNVPWQADGEVRAVATSGDDVVLLPLGAGDEKVVERVGGYSYELRARGFWQGHISAPEVFVREVNRLVQPQVGEHIIDLYAGAGLFSVPLADAVGLGGRLDAVEGDNDAARALKKNIARFAQAQASSGDVLSWLKRSGVKKCDAVVLDPPRVGAGKEVLQAIARLRPSRIVYVACDPAALARDIADLAELGFKPTEISAWDAFPMTGHFETIVRFN